MTCTQYAYKVNMLASVLAFSENGQPLLATICSPLVTAPHSLPAGMQLHPRWSRRAPWHLGCSPQAAVPCYVWPLVHARVVMTGVSVICSPCIAACALCASTPACSCPFSSAPRRLTRQIRPSEDPVSGSWTPARWKMLVITPTQ